MKIVRKLLFWIPFVIYVLYTIFVWVMMVSVKLDEVRNPDQDLAGLGIAIVLVYLVLVFYSMLCLFTTITSCIGFSLTKKAKKNGYQCSNRMFLITLLLPIVTEIITVITIMIIK